MSIERSPTFEYGLNLMNGFQRRFRDETSHPWAIILIAPFIIAHHTFDPQWSWQKKCLFFLCYIPAIIVAYMLELLAYYIFFFIAPFRVIYSFVLITFETIDVLSKFLLDHVGGGIVLALTGGTILCTQCFGAHHILSLETITPWLWLTALGVVCVIASRIPNYHASRHFGEAYRALQNNSSLWITSGIHALTITLLLDGIIPLLTLPLSPWTMYGMGMLACISPLLIKTITFLATKPDDNPLHESVDMSQFIRHKIVTACASLGVIALFGALTPLQLGSSALMCPTYVLILFGMLCFGIGLLVFTAKRASINHLLRITMGNVILCGISIGCCFPMFHTLSTSVIGIVFLSLLPLLLLLLPIALEKTLPEIADTPLCAVNVLNALNIDEKYFFHNNNKENSSAQPSNLNEKIKNTLTTLTDKTKARISAFYTTLKNGLSIEDFTTLSAPKTPIYVNQQWYDLKNLKIWWRVKKNHNPYTNKDFKPNDVAKINAENRLAVTYLAFAYHKNCFKVLDESRQDDKKALKGNDLGIKNVETLIKQYDRGQIDSDFANFILQIKP